MALQLHQLQGLYIFTVLQLVAGLLVKEPVNVVSRAIENYRDVLIPREPRIGEERARGLFKFWRKHVSKPVECLAQGGAPFLIPSRAAGATAAIRTPSFDPVNTAPGSVFDDFHFVCGRMLFKKITIDGELSEVLGLDVAQGIAQGHVAVGPMMSVGFPVGGDVRELRPLPLVGESAYDPPCKVFASHQDIFKSHSMGNRPIKKEQGDTSPRWQIGEISSGGINLASTNILPLLFANKTHSLRGMRRKHGEANLLLCQDLQRFQIHSRFGHPHPLRIAPKSVLKITNSPDDLRGFVPVIGERQDHVVVSLRHGCAMAAEAPAGFPVGCLNRFIEARIFCLDPGNQCRTEIKADFRVVVYDVYNFLFAVQDA